MESKGDVSSQDSGLMLHSGPHSPGLLLKNLRQAVRKQQELEAKLEACLEELRKLCLREAELTGMLPQEYPLRQGDKAPLVRRRIGAAFRLDEKTIVSRGVDPLSMLERDLALQLQIVAAVRHLHQEENLSKHVRKRRKSTVLKEERKLKELESALNEWHLAATQEPRPSTTAPGEPRTSGDSSISHAILLQEGEPQALNHPAARQLPAPSLSKSSPALPARSAPPQQCRGLPPTQHEELECSSVQHSPWVETSLERPCVEPKEELCSMARSPAGAPVLAPTQRTTEVPCDAFVPIRTVALQRQAGYSGPPTPEMQARQRPSEPMRASVSQDRAEPHGRSTLARRRPTYYTITVPSYCFPPCKPSPASSTTYHSSSEDTISDGSSMMKAPLPGSSSPNITFLRPVAPPSHQQGCAGQRSTRPDAVCYHHTPSKQLMSPSCFPAGPEFHQGYRCLWAGSPVPVLHEQDVAQLHCQAQGPAQSRTVRAPSLKNCVPARGRALSRLAVSEELKLWHERTKLRSLRPHSLDRQGAFCLRHTRSREPPAAGQQVQAYGGRAQRGCALLSRSLSSYVRWLRPETEAAGERERVWGRRGAPRRS
ncbi:innate immunity activator protein [Carettochelys insculpta]|uniref:innate immunity activator protein n=1 Tax=Carettochelys insculpta TaxID=44489 RepID=UPI003EC09D11